MPDPTDTDLVGAFLAAVDGLSTTKAADRAPGVTQMDVSRWRRGDWKRLNKDKRQALLQYVNGDVTEGAGHSEQQAEEAEQSFADALQVARYLGGVAPPGEEKAVKLDILEGIKRTILIREPGLPEWWYTLRGKVEDDAL